MFEEISKIIENEPKGKTHFLEPQHVNSTNKLETSDVVEIVTKALNVDLEKFFNNIDDWENPSDCIINFDCHSLGEAQKVKSIWNKFCSLCNRENEKREIFKFKNGNGTFTYRFSLLEKLKDCRLDTDGCYVEE